MRIALYHNLPSGGGKRALFEWTRRLADNHTIDIYSLSTADHEFCDVRPFASRNENFEYSPHKLFKSPLGRLNQFQRWRDLGDLERLNRQIAKQINQGDYDVLFANTCKYTFIPALIQFVEIPSVYYLHEPFGPGFVRKYERPCLSKKNWRDILNQLDPLIWLYNHRLASIQTRNVRRTKRLLANSQFTRECIRKEFGEDAEYCQYGVDLNSFYPVDVPRDDYIVSVGEMSPRKGFDFIVESLGKIPKVLRPPLKIACNMVLDDEMAYVKELAERNDVSMDVLVGLGVDELRDLYNRARLCVYAPVQEPFGLVPLEAMACATPVVGVQEGGVRESILHEKTGLLVARNSEVFGAAIQRMLSNPDLAVFGRNGREHVIKNWTWDKSVSILIKHLTECAGV